MHFPAQCGDGNKKIIPKIRTASQEFDDFHQKYNISKNVFFFQRSNTMVQDPAVNILKKRGHCLNKPSSKSNDKLMEVRE